MARMATPVVQPNLRHGRYVMRVKNDVVTWIRGGDARPPQGQLVFLAGGLSKIRRF